MKLVRLLLIFTLSACAKKKKDSSTGLTPRQQYDLYSRADSMASANPDSAFAYYFNISEILTDSLYKGVALQKMALLQQAAQDYHGSNESAMRSALLFTEKMHNGRYRISYSYNLLGSNCIGLQRLDDAYRYYDLAISFSDSANYPYFLCNKGVAFQRLENYDSAKYLYEQVLKTPGLDTTLYCRARSNLANTKWLIDPSYPAAEELHEARILREMINDKEGLNASYMHLSDYYLQDYPDSAKYYAEKMYNLATLLRWPDDQADALEKLALLASGSDFRDYLNRYVQLKDSINTVRITARNQYADIRFNVDVAKAENLVLEKDNSEKKLRIIGQQVIIYSTILLFILVSIFGVLWYKRRKRIQVLQTRNAIRESELKTSQKVHDVVANGLYRIMADLEHKNDIPKETLLDNIEDLYEQSRDISYERPLTGPDQFPAQLNTLLSSFATPSTKVLVVGNQDMLWKNVSQETREEMVYVLQELMVNMKKHSGASNVVVRFQAAGQKLRIFYKDDGKGLAGGYQPGNGMQNTGNRIKRMGGTIIFDTNPGKGLSIEITIPTSKAK